MRYLLIFVIMATLFSYDDPGKGSHSGLHKGNNASGDILKHPDWCYQAVIYEVNIRQYTPEGTFRAFEAHLPRLKAMGVKILWLMPVQPIGMENRKGTLGSYYSIRDYYGINPEFGDMEDFKHLVKSAHRQGFKIIIDWVADHSSRDNGWTRSHPEYYLKDSAGKFVPPVKDWVDVIKLNYENPELQQAILDAMKWWVEKTGVDGFRCDVADMVPLSFWEKVRSALDSIKPVFMLGEMERPDYHHAFDASYTWTVFHTMNEIAEGTKTTADLDEIWQHNEAVFPRSALRMYFTVNHDENSWNGTEFEKMGAAAGAFAVLTFTLPGIPLIYSGQEAANKKRLRFFDKDTIQWDHYSLEGFYHTLIALKSRNPALAAGGMASFSRIKTSAGPAVYAYLRKRGEAAVLVFLNLSGKPGKFTLNDPALQGYFEGVFEHAGYRFPTTDSFSLPAWGYKVLERKKDKL